MSDLEFYSNKNPLEYVAFFNKRTKKSLCPICNVGKFVLLHNDEDKLAIIKSAAFTAGDEEGDDSVTNLWSYIIVCKHCCTQQLINAKSFVQKYEDEMAGNEGAEE